MQPESKGRGLFIVDNGVSSWAEVRSVEVWSSIGDTFDVATSFFEIGALLVFDDKWQGFDKIRILVVAETTHRARELLLDVPAVMNGGRRSPMPECTAG